MAPPALKKLIALQTSRSSEMRAMLERIREKRDNELNPAIIQTRLDNLHSIWHEVRRTHDDIIGREGNEEESYVVENVFSRIQGGYEDVNDFLLVVQRRLEIAEQPAPLIEVSNVSTRGDDPAIAKLPRMPLPIFSGEYEDWESFSDLFTSLVHDIPRYSNATKLQYLKSCLRGSAAELVRDVKVTNANYNSTWQSLKARYYNPRLIIFKHFVALMQLPHLKKESAVELRCFTDEAQRIVRALENFQLPVEQWNLWFVFIIAERLDPESRKLWESELSLKDREAVSNIGAADFNPIDHLPTFSALIEFLERRAQTLSMLNSEQLTVRASSSRGEKRSASISRADRGPRKIFHAAIPSSSPESSSRYCPHCKGLHPLYRCFKFKALSHQERQTEVKRLRLCFNCFGQHRVKSCKSSGRCSTANCNGKHHTLLHKYHEKVQSQSPDQAQADTPSSELAGSSSTINVHTAGISSGGSGVILPTAQVIVMDIGGHPMAVRALLDQGSEASFITEAIVQLLELPRRRDEIPLSGLGGCAAGTARSVVRLQLRSACDVNFKVETEALVLPRLTSRLPARQLVEFDTHQLRGLALADPQFLTPNSIDLILGADVYGQLLRSGLLHFAPSRFVAQNTVFGWVVSGAIGIESSWRAGRTTDSYARVLHGITQAGLDQTLQHFWTLEEIPTNPNKWTPEEERCENQFKESYTRNKDGRYLVALLLKEEPPSLASETRRMSLASLVQTHRRFSRDPVLAESYRNFMKLYEELGHMTPIPREEIKQTRAWYLPHHAVVTSSNRTNKTRIVFDASRQTHDGASLNQYLMKGPKLQHDLSLILLGWRRYQYVFTADIVKMFRQILMLEGDRDLQRIVWSPEAGVEPVDYRLNTVTYGTASAPFLANRVMLQLIKDEGSRFPLGAKCLESHTYVDDIFAGSNDFSEAVQMRVQLCSLLRTAGFELDKWAANCIELLPPLTPQNWSKLIDESESVKTLGIYWKPAQDEFRFRVTIAEPSSPPPTKRMILSNISRLFDPLGWLAPVTVTAKILMQDLWILKCGWDAPLPNEIQARWIHYCNSLSTLSAVGIPRWFGSSSDQPYQIHGFSDASSRAYAAAVYVRIAMSDGDAHTVLLTAKTKVAPVKTISVPNLELCGAVLLVKLILHVAKLDFLQNATTFAWSDSQIVLNWLRKHPSYWKTFVANRVSYIQTELPSTTWTHVSSKENPADLATRGCEPDELAECNLWWHGPYWLAQSSEHWPRSVEATAVFHSRITPEEHPLLTRFSSLSKLTRVIAYCRRPLVRLRQGRAGLQPLPTFLTVSELSEARVVAIRLAQSVAFAAEIQLLKNGKRLPRRHFLNKLNPFVSSTDDLLRVGGRLAHSNLPDQSKNPPILPRDSTLSRLFVRHAHHICLRGGLALTLSTLLRQVWMLGGSRLVGSIIHRCVRCQRVEPRLAHQLMGDLPSERVTRSEPFFCTGFDYAGPFQIRTTKGRGHKSCKGYIALFVCFTTRAIHLECFCRELAPILANDGTEWTFIPPSAPHCGGLWEAGVESAKHHLKRVVGERVLTFEEFAALLVQVEACLNSRPLRPLGRDVDDLTALTPARFLSGGAAAVLPDEAPPSGPESRLDGYRLLRRLLGGFWRRWAGECLRHLQERGEWGDPRDNFAVGQLVLVRDDRCPPAGWPLARVTEVYPGPDGLVRVVTVGTAVSAFGRRMTGLCPLLVERARSTDAVTGSAVEH